MSKKADFKKMNHFLVENGIYLFVLIAILIIPLCFIKSLHSPNGNASYNLFELAFGKSTTILGQKVKLLTFSFPIFLAIFLPFIVSIVNLFIPHNQKLLKGILICAAFLLAAILFFVTPHLAILKTGNTTINFGDWKIGAGAIINGIVCVLGLALGLDYTLAK